MGRVFIPVGTAVTVRRIGRWRSVRATVTGAAYGRIEVSFFSPDTGLPLSVLVRAGRIAGDPGGRRSSAA